MKPICLIGEARGENEERIGSSFVGASGIELLRMLDESGLVVLTSEDKTFMQRYYDNEDPVMIEMIWQMHPEVWRTNVFNSRPPGNRIEFYCGARETGLPGYPTLIKGKASGYVQSSFAFELERLADEIIAHDPDLVITLGNTPLWALCGTTGISSVRGTTRLSTHTVTGYKVLATYHPAAVLRQWELRPITVIDLTKGLREREYPDIRRPNREIWIEPSPDDVEAFIDRYLPCPLLSVDIETSGNTITEIGFAPAPDIALVIPFRDKRKKSRSFYENANDEVRVMKSCIRVLADPSQAKLFQNGMYDITFIWRAWGAKVLGASEDTMLLQHSLQPESLKSLGFLGSIYTDEGSWKGMRKHTETIKRDE